MLEGLPFWPWATPNSISVIYVAMDVIKSLKNELIFQQLFLVLDRLRLTDNKKHCNFECETHERADFYSKFSRACISQFSEKVTINSSKDKISFIPLSLTFSNFLIYNHLH